MTPALLFVLALGSASQRGAAPYVVDSARSTISFSVRRLAVSTLRGRFSHVSGSVSHDSTDLSRCSVTVVIRTASLDTDDKDRDRRLRGPDFLESRRYQEIRFVSNHVERTEDHFVAVGDLTVRGVTRQVRVPYDVAPSGSAGGISISGSTKISRRDFDLMWRPNPDLANLYLGDQVTIDLKLEASAGPRPKTP